MMNSKQLSQTAAAHKSNAHPTLPPTGFLRLPQVLSAFPISRSSWYAGVKSGLYPASVKLGPRTTAWKIADIMALIEKSGGQYDKC